VDQFEGTAANQNIFRDVNERVVEAHRVMDSSDVDRDRLIEVFCECGRTGCVERIELTRAEYERVRADPTQFVIAPGHEPTLVERLIEQTARYTIVQNEGRAAEQTRDPRLLH
jgi:hypothetical protein